MSGRARGAAPPAGPEEARLVVGHEAHLWYVSPDRLSDERLLEAYRTLLSPAELERNGRFVFPKGRREHLITRALLRTTLSTYRPAVDPRAWEFVVNRCGRPEVAAPRCQPALRFNLSHTDGLIACLVAAEREIGVDVENTARPGLAETIADRFFSPTEVDELRSLPVQSRRDRFFDYWTLKEAYIKARGLGLRLPLDQFSFHLGDARPIRISFGRRIRDDPESWQFDLLRPTPRHRLAVAIRRRHEPDLTLRVRSIVPPVPGRAASDGALTGGAGPASGSSRSASVAL